LVVAVATSAVLVVSVAVKVSEPAVLNVTGKVAIPFWNEMLLGSLAAVSELVTATLSEKVEITEPWAFTSAICTVTGAPRAAVRGATSTNCGVVEVLGATDP
jgi:hypothetical protein